MLWVAKPLVCSQLDMLPGQQRAPSCRTSGLARLAAAASWAVHISAPRLPNHWVVPAGNSKPLRAQPVRYQLHDTIKGCILWVRPPQQPSSRQDEAPGQQLVSCWSAVSERGSHGRQEEVQADGEKDLRST